MSFLKKCEKLEVVSVISFMAFLLFLPVFTNFSKVSNLFHLSITTMLLYTVILRKNPFLNDDFPLKTLAIVGFFLLYYSLTNLWTSDPNNIVSTLKHSFYFLFFLLMVNHCIRRYGILPVHMLIFFGCFAILVLTFFMVDKSSLLTNRLENGFFAAPENVIDLGGYFCLGILSGCIVVRESGKQWIYLPVSLLFIGLLLTQSRGPLLALLVSIVILFAKYKYVHLRHIIYIVLSIAIVVLFFFFTDYGSEFYTRMVSSYTQSFIRFGIWEHAIKVAKLHPILGWGFDKELRYVNSIGQHVTTTHSIYLSAFLKGGAAGVISLAALIVAGLIQAYKKYHQGFGLEASTYLFSLMFFVTQGMFVIGGPGESWVLFWLPLAIVLASHKV